MQTAVPAGTAVFRGKWRRTDSRFAAFGGRGGFALPFLRTEPALRAAPVFRSAYFPQRVHSTLCSKTLDLQVRSAHPPMPHRNVFQSIPVFRSAYSANRNARASAAFAASIKPYYGLCSKALDLQVRSAHPPMPHRNVFSKHPGVPLGLFGKPKRSSSSCFAAFGGRGELRSPLHPPLPPPSGYGTDSFKGSP